MSAKSRGGRSRVKRPMPRGKQPFLGFEQLEVRRLLTVEIEPNGTPATATAFAANETIEGTVLNVADVDFFKINLPYGSRLTVDTSNIRDARFTPTLPPPVEILDGLGNLLASSEDGRDVVFTSPRTSDYFVRMDSSNAFGTVTENYAMQSTLTNYSGVTESEPNNSLAQAVAVNADSMIRGSTTGADAVDLYSVTLAANEALSIDFAGIVSQAPGVRILNSAGTVLASDLSGLGASYSAVTAGTYYIEIGVNSAGAHVGEYVAAVNQYARAVSDSELSNSFDAAPNWDVSDYNTTMLGVLSSLSDLDVFRFEVSGLEELTFKLQESGSDLISSPNRMLTLFNEFGQFLAYSTSGTLSHYRIDAIDLGTYFVAISATSLTGLGAFGLTVTNIDRFSNQRDVPLQFIDFDRQQATHQGFAWVSAYGVPAAIPFVVGLFESRYEAFDVDVTLTAPTTAEEIVTHGYGNFGDIGAGGWGGGGHGQRRSSGAAVTAADETSWTRLSYNSVTTLMHEYGHSVGLPHARLATALMSYVGTNEYIPVGDGFSFLGTDSRRPGSSVVNERNYLDWSLQSGSQAFDLEPNNSQGTAQPLNDYFKEMSFDVTKLRSTTTGDAPNQVLSGDFNGDGRRDLVVATADSDEIRVYLGNGSGVFSANTPVRVDDIGWWTEPMVVADFNGDGRSDVVSISQSQQRASILIASTTGVLANPVTFSIGNWPQAVAAGDINADGRLDLIAANSNSRVSVAFGDGTGGFTAPVSYNIGSDPYSLTVGDFDGNGTVDVVVANRGSDNISILFNTGGVLGTATHVSVAEEPRSITAGDFNGDGKLDLAVASRVDASSDSGARQAVTVLLNPGAGAFSTRTYYDAQGSAETIATGDVNRDGQLDLIVGGFDNALVALLGNSNGTFGRPVTVVGGDAEYAATATDFTGDGFADLAVVSYFSDRLDLYISKPNDLRNDRVTVFGEIDSRHDRDIYSLQVKAGQTFTFDIDSAEFQYPLDAQLQLLDSAGTVIASNQSGLDRDSGLDSVDPYVTQTFASDATITIVVTGERGSVGDYRLKATPTTAYQVDGPRVIAALPDNGAVIDSTRQLTFYFDDLLDPTTINASTITVRGASAGVRAGSFMFDPLESALVWTANAPLPVDTYTVTLSGGAAGIRDLLGNALDGEIAADFRFPTVSGNGTPGGDFVTLFTINANDTVASNLNSMSYDRDPYQRGQFTLWFSDELSTASAESAVYTLRGAGPDQLFDTADDRRMPLDVSFNKIRQLDGPRIELYSRGIPDPDQYRVEADIVDAAGNSVAIRRTIIVGAWVPEAALFQDTNLTTLGLVGSYVNSSLRNVTSHADWRSTQTISGTRTDYDIGFSSSSFGSRAAVGITGGSDTNWDNFSAQWDGWISVPEDGTRLLTVSDDGSRMWVDVNSDGQFAADSTEFSNNGWGTGQGLTAGALSAPLAKGKYQIRIQYEEGTGGNAMMLHWITPNLAGQANGYGHGPTVVGMSVPANTVYSGQSLRSVDVLFSGAVDLTTLTTANFKLRYSADAEFYDGDDVYRQDADGLIAWDATQSRATLQTAQTLPIGYYLVELNGTASGIKSTAGQLLDGEFLSTSIPGNTTSPNWSATPSGDGIPGGDYRAFFVIGSQGLSLQVTPASIPEKDGTATATVERLNAGDLNTALVVSLSSSDTTEATVPATVTIPAGQSSVQFQINSVDDSIIDGEQLVTILATATNFESSAATIKVTDVEVLQIQASANSISEFAGSVVITLTRPNSTGTQAVSLNVDPPNRLGGNATISTDIPAGQFTRTLTLNAIDNNLIDGNQLVTISATSTGLTGSQVGVMVTDHEPLSLAIAAAAIAEDGGSTTATVTRTDPNGALTVTITSLDADEATAPASVSFVHGQLVSEPFVISAVNDNSPDGLQVARFVAAATGYINATDSVEVVDSETLGLSIDQTLISERGGRTFARIRRNDPTGNLVVTISNSRVDTVSVVSTVTIANGQTVSPDFLIVAIDNAHLDGQRVAGISISAANYLPTTVNVQVTDYEPLTVTYVGTSSISERNGSTTAFVTRTDATGNLTVTLISSDPTEALTPASVFIPAGALVSSNFTIAAVDDQLLDGTQAVLIRPQAAGYVTVDATLQVQDYESLSLHFDKLSIDEQSGQALMTITRNNTDISQPLVVQLLSSDATELSVPATVTIEAQRQSVTVSVSGVDDQLLDGPQEVQLTAAAPGYAEDGVGRITITDVEALTLALDRSTISERGGQVKATVTRNNTDIAQSLEVFITTGQRLTGAIAVTIPAGVSAVDFDVTAQDDNLLQGTFNSSISVAATGYVAAARPVSISDFEQVFISANVTTISERNGNAVATLTRSNTNIDRDLVVILVNSDTSEATVPATVTIPAGQNAVTFVISGMDDTLLDGAQSVVLSTSAPGYESASLGITVSDYEVLQFSLDKNSISELGGTATGTIHRALADSALPLTVDLISSNPAAATVIASVTLPANASSGTFLITAVDDDLLDGSQAVSIIVNATGYIESQVDFQVTDSEAIFLSTLTNTISESGGAATIVVRRSNRDVNQPITVALSTNRPDKLLLPGSVTIPSGEAFATVIATAIDNTLLDGEHTASIFATSPGYTDGSLQLQILDHEALAVTFSKEVISEKNGVTLATVRRSISNASQSLTIVISEPTGRLAVPETIFMVAGETAADFVVSAVDDDVLNGTRDVALTIGAIGYVSNSVNVTVNDYEPLVFEISATSISEFGGVARVNVRRSVGDLSGDLVVALSSNDASELQVPEFVTIASGLSSATFDAVAVDDSILDGTQLVLVKGTAAGFIDAQQQLSITDFELLSIELAVATMSELNGSLTGTISRGSSNSQNSLVVNLSSSDRTEAVVPASITIPAGQSSIAFTVTAVDDIVLDGPQQLNLTAVANGFVSGSKTITVEDFEVLTVTIDATSLNEKGGTRAASVSRSNVNLENAITVQLVNSHSSRVTMPSTVTIASGTNSAQFTIQAIDNFAFDGNQAIQVSANLSQYQSTPATVTVIDNELLRPWTNPRNPLDVNNSGAVTPLDALLVINELNLGQAGPLPPRTTEPKYYFDTSNDNILSPRDALLVINELNRLANAEGESSPRWFDFAAEELDRKKARDRFFESFGLGGKLE
jgi:FG-GAP-like repeat/Dockerin type I domain/PA14 domain/Calx-beta domain